MREKKAQFNFSLEINKCDTLIQLKDGKILLYNLTEFYNIHTYDDKTFHKLYEIDLYKPIYEYEKIKEELSTEYDSSVEDNRKKNKNKNCFKELQNDFLLYGRDKYLIELKLYNKKYEYKIIKQLDNIISDINELSDKRILLITIKEIIIFNKYYIIK